MSKRKLAKFKSKVLEYKSCATKWSNSWTDNSGLYFISKEVDIEDKLVIELLDNVDLNLLYKNEEFLKKFYSRCRYYRLP